MKTRGRLPGDMGFMSHGMKKAFGQDRRERCLAYGQSAFFLFSLALLLGAIGYWIGHAVGSAVLLLSCLGAWLAIRPGLPGLLLRRLHAVPMDQARARGIVAIVEELARRSALPRLPEIYYVPSLSPNAFVATMQERSMICVTAGLLAVLSPRELVAVLAHEVSHIRAGDAWLMMLSAQVLRCLLLVAFIAQLVLWALLPAMWSRGQLHTWAVHGLVLLLPTLATLLQLALCRRRELAADRQAALLTGDPGGLMAALRRLDGQVHAWSDEDHLGISGGTWLFWLRSHPSTRTRLEHLMHLKPNAVPGATGREGRLIDHLLSLSQPPSPEP